MGEGKEEQMTISDDARKASVHFEAVQIAMMKNKDGYVLKLAIHPNDVPESLLRDLVGCRYMVAMCKLDDENLPVEPPQQRERDREVTSAGMLCREPTFWRYLENIGAAFEVHDEQQAADALKDFLGVKSRAELRDNKEARETWQRMIADFRKRTGS